MADHLSDTQRAKVTRGSVLFWERLSPEQREDRLSRLQAGRKAWIERVRKIEAIYKEKPESR